MKSLFHSNAFTAPAGGVLVRCHSRFPSQEEKFQFSYPDGVEYRFHRLQPRSHRTGGPEEPPAEQQNFAEEKKALDAFVGDLLSKQESFDELLESLADCKVNPDLISDSGKEEIKALTDRANADLELVRREIRVAKEMVNLIANQFNARI